MAASAKKSTHRKYSKGAQSKVKKVMHERKHGTLRSGSSGKKVTSRKQAIAIGLSEARRAGKKVPPRKKAAGSRTSSRKRATTHRKRTSGSRKKKSS